MFLTIAFGDLLVFSVLHTTLCVYSLNFLKTLLICFIHVFYIQNIVLFALCGNCTLFVLYLIATLVFIHFGQSLTIRFRITSFQQQFTLSLS